MILGAFLCWADTALTGGEIATTITEIATAITHGGGLASLRNLADAHPEQTYLEFGPLEGWTSVIVGR